MSASTHDISVIIPYYNREQYIDETVQSVLAQTLKPLEIIIVNDRSRESSRKHIERYTSVCKILDLERNVGLAGARNAGTQAARGQFIALLDDDDIWYPHKLEVQRKYMDEHPECALVHSAVTAFFSDKPDQLWVWCEPGNMTMAKSLTDKYWACPSSMFFRTEAAQSIGGFDSAFRQCEDRDFLIRACAAGLKVQCIPEPLLRLRRENHDRLTSHKWTILRTDLKMCWKHRKLYHRAYGVRGIVNFVLEKSRVATCETRYLDGAGRLVLRFVDLKYAVRRDYQDPVTQELQLEHERLLAG
jgi:glycosyltransferase involved in cell wall biosynthesis